MGICVNFAVRYLVMKIYALLLALAAFGTAVAGDYTLQKDISYYTGTDSYATERCKVDVYAPADTAGCPVVVWFHGGGLTGGNKKVPRELKDAGYVVVAANYRRLPHVAIDSCITDAARAVAWTFANAERYGGDSSKIFVAGHSAGGYLTSMIGLDKKWLGACGIDPDSIRGLAPYSGQMITHFALRKSKGISELQPTIDEYAPLFHVRPDAPPFIIITGDREEELYGRYEEDAYMWRMMKLAGHPDVYLYEIGGYNHGGMQHPAHHILKKHIKRILNTEK